MINTNQEQQVQPPKHRRGLARIFITILLPWTMGGVIYWLMPHLTLPVAGTILLAGSLLWFIKPLRAWGAGLLLATVSLWLGLSSYALLVQSIFGLGLWVAALVLWALIYPDVLKFITKR